MKSFSIAEAYRAAWHTLRAHSAVLLTGALVLAVLRLADSLVLPQTFDEPRIAGVFAIAVVSAVLGIAFFRVALRLMRGEEARFADLVPSWSLAWRYVLATILQLLATLGGFVLLIIPGIFIMVRLFFVGYAVVDGSGPFDALKKSGTLTRGVFWHVAAFFVTQLVLDWIGALTYVGLVITLPLTALASAHVYDKLKQRA